VHSEASPSIPLRSERLPSLGENEEEFGMIECLRFISYIFSFTILCLLFVFKCGKSSAIHNARTWGISMSSVTRLALVLILLSGLGSAQWVFAQGTDLGTIQGTVKDASGAVIANAKVTVIDVDTNTPRETKANGAGDFEVFGLRSGRYKVSVTASGMRKRLARCDRWATTPPGHRHASA
jgi:hypothetical protein